jgi:hypothetical protein
MEVAAEEVLRDLHPVAEEARMSLSGVKSAAIACAAASTVASVQSLPISAASALAARFGTPAMPPKAIRALVTRPPSTVTLKQPQTAEISWSKRLDIL